MKRVCRALVFSGLVGLSGFGVAHADAPKKDKGAKTAPAKGAKTAEEQKMEKLMADVEKLATPSEGHKRLAPMVGKWKTDSQMWMDPSKPPMKMAGTDETKWELGDRFLTSEYKGEMMGKPFVGLGTIGYDNHARKYQMTWRDTMTTCTIVMEGIADATGKVLTFSGEIYEPMFDKNVKQRWVIKLESDSKHLMEFYVTAPDGKEMKSMEIVYTK